MNRKVIRLDGGVSWYMDRPLSSGKQILYALHFSVGEYEDRATAARRVCRARSSLRESIAEENAHWLRRERRRVKSVLCPGN